MIKSEEEKNYIMNKITNLLFATLLALPVAGQTVSQDSASRITTNRQDGRFLSTRGTVQYMLKSVQPAYAFNPSFTPAEFKKWQSGLRDTMKELMRFPQQAEYRLRCVLRPCSATAIV